MTENCTHSYEIMSKEEMTQIIPEVSSHQKNLVGHRYTFFCKKCLSKKVEKITGYNKGYDLISIKHKINYNFI